MVCILKYNNKFWNTAKYVLSSSISFKKLKKFKNAFCSVRNSRSWKNIAKKYLLSLKTLIILNYKRLRWELFRSKWAYEGILDSFETLETKKISQTDLKAPPTSNFFQGRRRFKPIFGKIKNFKNLGIYTTSFFTGLSHIG